MDSAAVIALEHAAAARERLACADLLVTLWRSLPDEPIYATQIKTLQSAEKAIRNRNT